MGRRGGRHLKGWRPFTGTLTFALFGASTAMAAESRTLMEEFMIPAVDPGIRLYMRNKHPQGVKKFAPGKILLFVHGATYPAETES